MYAHVTKKTSIERVHPEGRNLSFEIADKINSYSFDGVYLVKESKRYYPNKNMLSHVLGYTGVDNQGLSGIELLYDEYLTGEDGAINIIVMLRVINLIWLKSIENQKQGLMLCLQLITISRFLLKGNLII